MTNQFDEATEKSFNDVFGDKLSSDSNYFDLVSGMDSFRKNAALQWKDNADPLANPEDWHPLYMSREKLRKILDKFGE